MKDTSEPCGYKALSGIPNGYGRTKAAAFFRVKEAE